MEEIEVKKRNYREEVKGFLEHRHISETVATLIWLRVQKQQSCAVKGQALKKVQLEVEVLDELIKEAEEEDI